MIIKELLVHDFGEGEDLVLADLAPGLNVIRVPQRPHVDSLHQFIPAMLYGPENSESPVSGSIVGEYDSQEFECLRLDDDRLPGLHLLDAQGRSASTIPIREHLLELTERGYLSVFTDLWPVSSRSKTWQSIALINRCLADNARPPESSIDERRTSALRAENDLRDREVQTLIDQRIRLLADRVSRTPPRDEFLEACQTAQEFQKQTLVLENELTGQRDRVSHLKLAVDLLPACAHQRELKDRIDVLRAIKARPRDARRIKQIERQLLRARKELATLRARAKQHKTVPHDDARPALSRLASQHDEVTARQARLSRLREQLSIETNLRRKTSSMRDALIEQIRSLRQAAARLRQARHTFRQAVRQSSHWPHTAHTAKRAIAASPPQTNAPFDSPDIEQIRRQLRRLQSETRALLQRRILPPKVALTLGLAFAIGVVLILAAVFWDLGGANISVGAIGVTTILASSLLKMSFTAPGAKRLNDHRQRIDRLTNQINRRSSVAPVDRQQPPPESQPDLNPRHANLKTETASMSEGRHDETRIDLERAFADWRHLLDRLDLARDLTPPRAVGELRRRFHSSTATSSQAPDTTPQIDALTVEISEHENWLDNWRRQVALVLSVELAELETPSFAELIISLQDAMHQVSLEQQTAVRNPTTSQEETTLQSSIKELKRAHSRTLKRSGATDLEHLRSLLDKRRQLHHVEAEYQKLCDQIEAKLLAAPSAKHARLLLDTEDATELERRLSKEQSEVRRLQSQLDSARRRHAAARDTSREFAHDQQAAWLQSELAHVSQRLVMACHRRHAAQIATALAAQVATQVGHGASADVQMRAASPVLADASRRLQVARQTSCELRYDAQRGEIVHVDSQGNLCDLSNLPTQDAQLISLCVQVAVANELSMSGLPFPFVLRDTSLGYPADHAIQVARMLVDAAEQGLQLLLFTSHASVSEMFGSLHVPTLYVDMAIPESSRESAVDASDEDPFFSTNELDETDGDWIPVEYQVVERIRPGQRSFPDVSG